MPAYHLKVTQEFDLSAVRAFVQGSIAEMRSLQQAASAARSARDPVAQAAIQGRATQLQTGIEEGLGRLQGQRTAANASIIDPTSRTLRADLERLERVYGIELQRGEELNRAKASLTRELQRSVDFERRRQGIHGDPTSSADAARERRDVDRHASIDRKPGDDARERADRLRRQEADTKFDDEVRERRARLAVPPPPSTPYRRNLGSGPDDWTTPAGQVKGTRETRAEDRVKATTRAASPPKDDYYTRHNIAPPGPEGESVGQRDARAKAQAKIDGQRYRASEEGIRLENEANRLKEQANDELKRQSRARRAQNEGIEDEARDKALDVVDKAKLKGATADVLSDQPSSVNALAESQLSTAALGAKIRRESEALVAERRATRDPQEMARLDDKLEGLKQQQVRLAEEDVLIKQGHLSRPENIQAFRDQANTKDVYKQATRSDRQIAADQEREEKKAQRIQDQARVAAERENTARNVQANNIRSFANATKSQQAAILNNAHAAALKEDAARGYHAKVIQETAEHERRLAERGSLIQRVQQRAASRPGTVDRPATEFATGRQLLTQGALSAARFGAGAGLLYGGISTIKGLIQDSSELERIFNQIQRQFESVGEGEQFAGFKKGILDISKLTGEAAKDVAFVAFQMKGAFKDTDTAIEATTDAIKVARVTALPLNEIVDSLTAASKSFGVSIAAVGDEALGLQERFGVLAVESIKVFGDLGPAAAAAGLDIKQLGALIGAVQQVSGRSGGVIAESLGRVLPEIGTHASQLIGVYQGNAKLREKVPELTQDLRQGQTGKVLVDLVKHYDDLTTAEKQEVVAALGGSRNAQTLNAIFNNRAKVIEEVNRAQTDLGKTEAYFSDLQETLTQRLDRVKAQFTALGLAIFQSGLGDILKDLVGVGGVVLHILAGMAGALAALNRNTGGVAVKLLEVYAALKLIQLLGRGLGGGVGGRAGGALDVVGQVLPGLRTRFAEGRADIRTAKTLGVYGGAFDVGVPSSARTAAIAGSRVGSIAEGGLAAVGGLPTVAIVGAMAVGAKYQSERSKNEKVADEYAKKLKEATDAQVEELRKDQGGLIDRIQERLGFRTVYTENDKEQSRRNLARLGPPLPGVDGGPEEPGLSLKDRAEAAKNAGLLQGREKRIGNWGWANQWAGLKKAFTGKSPMGESTQQFIDKALEGDIKAQEDLENQIKDYLSKPGADPAVIAKYKAEQERINNKYKADKAKAQAESGAMLEAVVASKDLYEAGETTLADFLQSLADDLATQEAGMKGLSGDALEKATKARDAIKKTQSQIQSETQRKILDYNLEQAELGGGGGPEAEVAGLTRLLANPQFTDRSERETATKDLMKALKAQLQEEADMADSAADRAAILRRGIQVPEAARAVVLEQQIRALDADWVKFLNGVQVGSMTAAELLTAVAKRAAKDSITVAQAMRAIMRDKIAEVFAQIIRVAMSGRAVPGELDALIADFAKLQDQYNQPIPDSIVTTPTGTIKGSKTDQKKADDSAKKEAEAKAKEAKSEAEAQAKARLALEKALHEGDPVAIAQAAIEEAKLMMQLATKDSERINAQAQLVLAQHALIAAQGQVADAYANIDKALHLAADDTVAAAQDEINAAQRHLANAQERGDMMGELAAKAELIAANRGKVDAEVGLRQERIDTGLALETMSTQEAIATYEGMMAIPGVTKKMVDQFLIKIHQLRKEASADLTFDIPPDIKLPTLYEVRRLRQTEASGGGYQDNRQIAVQYNVFTPQDNQAAMEDLVGVMSGSPRVGSTPRTYP